MIADFRSAGEKSIPVSPPGGRRGTKSYTMVCYKNVLFLVFHGNAGPGAPARNFPHFDSRFVSSEDRSVLPPGCFGRTAKQSSISHVNDESVIVEKLLFGGQ